MLGHKFILWNVNYFKNYFNNKKYPFLYKDFSPGYKQRSKLFENNWLVGCLGFMAYQTL